jgi:hypothetical protein
MAKQKNAKAKKPAPQQTPSIVLPRYWRYAAIFIVILLVAGIRFRLRNTPLERDEGEYAYAGQLILQGVPPYQLAYNMKLPGTYAAYAVALEVFGQTPAGIHLGILIANAATTLLVFFLGDRLFGSVCGVVAGATYALLSVSPRVLGLAGHATHFVALLAVASILLLLKSIESKKFWLYVLAGLLSGLAFLMKQPGIFFVLFGLLYLVRKEWPKPLLAVGGYLAGAVIPYLATCLVLARAGVFHKFWFWTVTYAAAYGTSVGISAGVNNFFARFIPLVASSPLIWLAAAFGIAASFRDRDARAHADFVLGFLVFSFAAVSAGLYFRDHYYILMLPAVSLLVGVAIESATRYVSNRQELAIRSLPALYFILALGSSLFLQREILFEMDPVAACRAMYGENPFPEAIDVSRYIEAHSTTSDQVAVLGSEPEIYFYSHRRSTTGYIYTYALMEDQKFAAAMQKEMIAEIVVAKPKFLVYVSVPTSWAAKPNSDTEILSWSRTYVRDHYALVGIADTSDPSGPRWDADVANYRARSPFVLLVFKRNT